MNPRYLAYCRAHGNTVRQQIRHDRATWPGGQMGGFILWVAEQRREFLAAHPEAGADYAIWDQAAWDRWLGVTS